MFDDKVSDIMKEVICDQHNIELELVPPWSRQRNVAGVAKQQEDLSIWGFFHIKQSNCLSPQHLSIGSPVDQFNYNKIHLAPMSCKLVGI